MTKDQEIRLTEDYIEKLIDIYRICRSEDYAQSYLDQIIQELEKLRELSIRIIEEETFFN